MNIYLLTLIGYSALLIAVGLIAARKVKSASDFLVAGRKFGPGVIFATFLAANIGAAFPRGGGWARRDLAQSSFHNLLGLGSGALQK
jgi:Na+/proline symporter